MSDERSSTLTAVVTVPRLSANDDAARLVSWLAKPGDKVVVGQELCEIETTKAVSEVVSPVAGYVTPLIDIGASVAVNSPLAIVSNNSAVDRVAVLAEHHAATQALGTAEGVGSTRKVTRKAELLARRYGIDLATVTTSATDGVIREQDVEAARTAAPTQALVQAHERSATGVERVLVIGSVHGGGAAIVVDILLRSNTQLPTGVVDRDPTTHGTRVLGVPVLGTSDMENVKRLYGSDAFDAAIVAFNRNLHDRAAVFEELERAGIPIANAIDVNAEIRAGVKVGRGNVIAALSYLGPEVCIGDNNFLSSRTTIEHHCVVGSHCGFGPAVTFSGRVRVGNLVRFGTQIAAEPNIEIGDRAIIASSCVLTTDVAANAILKQLVGHRVLAMDRV